jgi:hypothetical protein
MGLATQSAEERQPFGIDILSFLEAHRALGEASSAPW